MMLISLILVYTLVLQRRVVEHQSKCTSFFTVIFAKSKLIHTSNFLKPICKIHFEFHFIGERPEAMQTGTSTYIANNIKQTIMISVIISTYNIFQNFYSSILFSNRIPNEITWHTTALGLKILAELAPVFQLRRLPHVMHVQQRW